MMMKWIMNKEKIIYAVEWILIFFWTITLLKSDAFFTPYLICSLLAYGSYKFERKDHIDKPALLLAVFFSAMVALANYSIFCSFDSRIAGTVFALGVLIGGSAVFYRILSNIMDFLELASWKTNDVTWKPEYVFAVCWLSIVVVDALVLFLCKYPGVVTSDNTDQIHQGLTGAYNNHHPYYHSLLISLFVKMGHALFGNYNAGVAMYSIFQIFYMAAVFSYIVVTVYQFGKNRKVCIALGLSYLLIPYNIIYSFTMVKDVIWAGFITVFIVTVFRIIESVGNSNALNYCLLILSSVGICLFRSNGLVAFIGTTVLYSFIIRKNKKKVLAIMIGAVAVSFALKYTVLEAKGINQPDRIESLSIPAQQIARVVVDGGYISDTDLDTLNKIIDVSEIRESYDSGLSDPVKNLVRAKGNQEYIESNKSELLRMYLRIGADNPEMYVKAWVDQTKGYWNSGYLYSVISDGIHENDMGIHRTVICTALNTLFDFYRAAFLRGMTPLVALGFFTWINITMLFVGIRRRDRSIIAICIPTIMMIGTLLIATPVFSEFRYAYSLPCCLPFICAVVLRNQSTEEHCESP